MTTRRDWITQIFPAVAAGTALVACKDKPKQLSFRMGERMQVGKLVYNAMETKWRADLGEMLTKRVPQNRFLLIRLAITNSGGSEKSIPMLTLESPSGETFTELQDGAGVDGWLGLLRNIAPAQTEEGWILFDVPPNNYNLRVVDPSDDPAAEQSLLISIPLAMDSMNDSAPVQPR